MYDLAVKIQSSEPLIEALCLLHYLLGNSPSNFHAKLLCLHLYHIIGCGIGAAQMYSHLDIKYIQLDSMGYLHCTHLPRIGITSIAKPLYGQTLKFFTTSYKESLEYLAMCYKFGSFSKLEEFMDFRERLSNSLHYATISAEMMLMEMNVMGGGNGMTIQSSINAIKGMSIMSCKDRIDWTALTDNRDLSVICRWDPDVSMIWPSMVQQQQQRENDENNSDVVVQPLISQAVESLQQQQIKQKNYNTENDKESFRQDIELLRIRVTLLRLIDACIDAVSNKQMEKNDQNINIPLTQIRLTWLMIFTKIRQQNPQLPSNLFLVNLLPSRLHGMLVQPYENHFSQLSRFILVVHQLNVTDNNYECPNSVAKDYENSIGCVSSLLVEAIKKHNDATDIIYGRRAVQEIVVNCIEVLVFVDLSLIFVNHFFFFVFRFYRYRRWFCQFAIINIQQLLPQQKQIKKLKNVLIHNHHHHL